MLTCGGGGGGGGGEGVVCACGVYKGYVGVVSVCMIVCI